MSRHDAKGGRLGALIAAPFRVGTVAALAVVAVGLVLRWLGAATGVPRANAPLVETIVGGGAVAITSVGLLLLTLVPLAVAIAATIGFWRTGERRYLVGSAVVTVLLVASLLVSAIVLSRAT
ncbi:MAG: DUF1634 domain-containing protein [Chloroflexota bacterium]|nr:DUF1634 domain-containing protein [Chloroflexota bacterium]